MPDLGSKTESFAPKPVGTDGPQRILVVDDEILNLKLISAMLKPQGYEVLTAGDGQDCLAKVRENPPDLILLDIMMPNMDGFEVVAELKKQESFSRIPIVMVTALQDVNDRVRALEVGADDFLTKPVERMELRARVRSLLKVKAYNDHMHNYRQELENEVARQTMELTTANKRIMEAHTRLRESSLEAIFRLSRAAEYKDGDTAQHLLNIGHLSAFLAEKMGLNKVTVERILYASIMHDIGKIGIPDHILTKNGPLNDSEWVLMKKHTIFGAQILKDSKSSFLQLGEIIAMTHHEKWDGSGYPNGLAGREIPLAGRIVAVADVFDSLMSKRHYKPALSLERTLDIIKEGRGSHFDPAVVDIFLDNIEHVIAMWEQSRQEQIDLLGRGLSQLEPLRNADRSLRP